MAEAVIVDAIRTPIGRAIKGSLKDMRADDLASVPLLLNDLDALDGTVGLESMCAAGGMGHAMIVERLR